MLFRLVKASKQDPNATTLEQYESVFLTIRKARRGTTFQQKPHITLGCVQTDLPNKSSSSQMGALKPCITKEAWKELDALHVLIIVISPTYLTISGNHCHLTIIDVKSWPGSWDRSQLGGDFKSIIVTWE